MAAAVGGKVILTDCEDAVEILQNCKETCLLNMKLFEKIGNTVPKVIGLTWGLLTSEIWRLNEVEPAQVLLGADVFYEETGERLTELIDFDKVMKFLGIDCLDFEDLISTVCGFMAVNPSNECVFYVAYQERSDTHRFMLTLLLQKWELEVEEYPIGLFFPEEEMEILQGRSFVILIIKKKQRISH